MSKMRSPNYPALSLPDAIGKLATIYQKEVQRKMSRAVAATHLGYGGLNGASITVISALLKYGLLEGRGDEIRVSPGGVAILVDPVGAPDRMRAMQEAARKPALFVELQKQFDGQVPSTENLQAYLQKQGFTATAASAAGRAYRDTMELVIAETVAHTPKEEPPPKPPGGKEEPIVVDETPQESLKMRVSKDCVVSLSFSGPVTQSAISKLIKKLEISKDEYPADE